MLATADVTRYHLITGRINRILAGKQAAAVAALRNRRRADWAADRRISESRLCQGPACAR